MANPFRGEAGSDEFQSLPCTVVIFGATGDLTHRKLVPALYNLARDGFLPVNFSLVGVGRRELSQDEFRAGLRGSVADFSRRKPVTAEIWDEFESRIHYVKCPFDSDEHYQGLKQKLNHLEAAVGGKTIRLFYLATDPRYFSVIAERLSAVGLLNREEGSDRKAQIFNPHVIVEKPFGHDLPSARGLNQALLRCMDEDQIYRIDHYLGKETVQNLLVFRFSNGMFEPIWNHKYIDHVEISVCESIGVGSRGDYFDSAGILRDIVQNHAFQLLCLVALEPPLTFDAVAVRDEKVKVLRAVRRIDQSSVSTDVVRAKYLPGYVGGKLAPGYLDEPKVPQDSKTETFVALKLFIDNWRWAGVPFFVRAGKRLPKRVTDISVFFRQVPHLLFSSAGVAPPAPNVLSFQIQPDEGISVRISSKPPGPKVSLQNVKMEFSYGTSFGVEPPEAYERLILDAIRSDATLFTRADEIEQAWELLENVFGAWNGNQKENIPVFGYEAGSWGPEAADTLVSDTVGYSWRRL